jgi:hypothetical protein
MRKNSVFMAGMLALLLTLGLALAGCSTDGGGDDDDGGGGGGGIKISNVIASSGWIYIDVGNGLNKIDQTDFTLQAELKKDFVVTVGDTNYVVVAVFSAGSSSSFDLVLAVGDTTFTEGTEYAIKIKYTKGTTPIAFDGGSELASFEIEKTIKAK